MNTVTKTNLEVGDLVHHEGRVWLAERMDATRPCEVQCAMHDGTSCHGYCFRWDNGEDFVFRFILPDMAVKEATTIVATPDLIAERLAGVTEGTPEAIAKAKYYEKVKALRAQRDVRPYGTGSLAPNRNGWRGEIYVGGERFVKYDTDKAVVLAWLDDMNAKKQALAKMDKLKIKKQDAEPLKVGRKSTGGIEEPNGRRKSYRAQIIIDGKRYRYTSQDRSEVEAWLDKMRKENKNL